MTDLIYVHVDDKIKKYSAHPLPTCKDVLDTLARTEGSGELLDGDDNVLDSQILEAGKHYTFVEEEATPGSRQGKPDARPPVTLDEDAETAYNNAEPLVRDIGCLLSAAQWQIFLETENAEAATWTTPTRTPVTTPATSRFAGLEVAGVGPGVVQTGQNALPAAVEARAVKVHDGVCAAWASGRACDGNCGRNHCELHSPNFDHALATEDRGRLARLLQRHADGQWPLALRQLPADLPDLPFVGRQAVLHAIGKQVNRGFYKVAGLGSHKRNALTLVTLTDGPGSGKTRLLSEFKQYCESQGSHPLQDKLGLDKEVQQVVKDALAHCVDEDFIEMELTEADTKLGRPDAALGLRVACASFDALPAHTVLQRELSGSEQEQFTLPNVLPILATAVRRRAAEKARRHAAAPESSKRAEQHLLLGILPDELQAVVEQMENLGVARDLAVSKGRYMLSAIGECIEAGLASHFKFVPFMLGAGTRVPQFDKFVPYRYNPERLYTGPLASDEIVGTLSAALASKPWANLFDGTESERRSQCEGILRRRPIAVMLAELSGFARLVQYAHSELATERVQKIVAGAEQGFDTAVAVHVRERVLEQV